MMLRDNGSDCFLIRESKGSLVLSLINHGETQHYKIINLLGWYSLGGWSTKFKQLNELVEYISTHDITSTGPNSQATFQICKKRMTRNKGQYNRNYNIWE